MTRPDRRPARLLVGWLSRRNVRDDYVKCYADFRVHRHYRNGLLSLLLGLGKGRECTMCMCGDVTWVDPCQTDCRYLYSGNGGVRGKGE